MRVGGHKNSGEGVFPSVLKQTQGRRCGMAEALDDGSVTRSVTEAWKSSTSVLPALPKS